MTVSAPEPAVVKDWMINGVCLVCCAHKAAPARCQRRDGLSPSESEGQQVIRASQ